MSVPVLAIPPAPPPAIGPPAPAAVTFGAICSRCNEPYETARWKSPYNHTCDVCLLGTAVAVQRDRHPIAGLMNPVIAWAAGS